MARPATNHAYKKAQIAEIALKVFSRHGFAGTTYKLIAQESKKLEGESISPSLIYHYFPEGKEQLFAESVSQLPSFKNFNHVLIARANEPPEIFLRLVTQSYHDFLKTPELLPTLRLILTEGINPDKLLGSVINEFVPQLLLPMKAYFDKLEASGQCRPMLFDQFMMQLLGPILLRRVALSALPLDKLPVRPSTDEAFLDSLVQTFLYGTIKPS